MVDTAGGVSRYDPRIVQCTTESNGVSNYDETGMGRTDGPPQRGGPGAFTIEGVRVTSPSMEQAVARIADECVGPRSFTVFTLNLDHCVKLRASRRFSRAYRRASVVTADGFPIVALGRLLGQTLERTTGADMVDPLCAKAAEQGLPVFLMGASDQVLQRSAATLRERHPGLVIGGLHAPGASFDPDGREASEAIRNIGASGARLCLVALGAPKQELFADRAARELDGVGLVCVGGALDFIAGHQTRAPTVFQKTSLEWLWRLATNPRRLSLRYARCAALLGTYAVEVLLASGTSRRSIGRA